MNPQSEKPKSCLKQNTPLSWRPLCFCIHFYTNVMLVSNQPLRSEVISLCASLAGCPAIGGTTTNFEEDERCQTFNSTVEQLWKETVPNGGFFIDGTRADGHIYGIAIFHQLRCLATVRSSFPGTLC
jgi:hypothetical protein